MRAPKAAQSVVAPDMTDGCPCRRRNAYNAKHSRVNDMQPSAGPELLHDWIGRAARRAPDKPWAVTAEDGRSVSYGALHESVGRFADFLRQRNIGPNDRVALLANNSIEQLLCYLGVIAAGATICNVHVEMNRNQIGNIFERLKPRLILHQDGL